MALKRQLSLFELTLIGVGMILGAGIYVLVGIAGVQAGSSLWLAFITAGVIAMLTGLSYAELAAMLPEAGSSFNYIKHAFKSDNMAFVSGWLFTASAIIAATAVSLGFAHYINSLGISSVLIYGAVFILIVGIALNIKGLELAAKANDVSALLEALGLVIVIIIGFTLTQPTAGFDMPKGLGGFFNAVALAFFAFLGFEVIANEAGEAKNPRRNVPLALIIAVLVSIILYALTALSFTSMVSYEQIVALTQGKVGPLASAAGQLAGSSVLLILSIIALFSTGNTVLLSITGASRMLYGMSVKKALPKQLSHTAHATPVNAVLLAGVASIALLVIGDIEQIANATVLGMLLVFALDNLAVVKLRVDQPKLNRPFRLPLSFANVPLTSVVGALCCIGLFVFTAIQMPVATAILAGFILFGLVLKKLAAATHVIPAKTKS